MKKEVVVFLLIAVLLIGCARPARPVDRVDEGVSLEDEETGDVSVSTFAWIDTHTHLGGATGSNNPCDTEGKGATCDCEACLDGVFAMMDTYNTELVLIFPPPQHATGEASEQITDGEEEEALLLELAQAYPDRFIFGAGGGTLNVMIQDAVNRGEVTEGDREEFEARAREIAEAGAHAFGEMAVIHITGQEWQYQEAPPDHELFLLLADVAAEYDIPVDIHMVPVEEDSTFPAGTSVPEGHVAEENIENLENLLNHNLGAKIVWAHVGWYVSQGMTPEIVSQLMDDHPNLYLQIHRGQLGEHNTFTEESGEIKEEYLTIIEKYPDRVILGSDSFWTTTDNVHLEDVSRVLSQLPEDLAQKIACENAVEIYNLDVTCSV